MSRTATGKKSEKENPKKQKGKETKKAKKHQQQKTKETNKSQQPGRRSGGLWPGGGLRGDGSPSTGGASADVRGSGAARLRGVAGARHSRGGEVEVGTCLLEGTRSGWFEGGRGKQLGGPKVMLTPDLSRTPG